MRGKLALVCAMVTLIAWAPACLNGFVWDDDTNIGQNPHLTLDRAGVGWMLTTYREIQPAWGGQWIPLTWLSLALDKAIWGYRALGYHLTNIVLHAVSAALVGLIAWELLRSSWGAALTSLAWSLHPLRVESVAWITERRDVLSGMLALLAVLGWLRGWRLWIVTGLFALAMTAKASVVTVPVALAVLELWRRRSPWRRLLPMILVGGGIASLTVWALHTARSLSWYPLEARVLMAAHAAVFYLVKTAWPTGLSLLYEAPMQIRVTDPRFGGSFLLVLAVTAAAVGLRRRWPVLLAAWAIYLVLLAPESGLLHAGFAMAADRYTYLPGLVPAFLFGASSSWWFAWKGDPACAES